MKMEKIIICNHKMFLDINSAASLKKEMEDIDLSGINLIISPSYINFDLFKEYKLCAQDCFYEDFGPYTGQISCVQLKQKGVNYSLVGHSYRRKYDTDKVINKKIKSLLKNKITPVLCVGEYKKDCIMNKRILRRQLECTLKDISLSNDEEIIIAYEPAWTIGSGMALTKDKLDDSLKLIKNILSNIGIKNYKLLYGGSVNVQNIDEIQNCNLDGYLLGSSSVNIEQLKNIVNYTKKCK